MLFKYKVIDSTGHELEGEIDAVNQDVAISSLQSRGFTITAIKSAEEKDFFNMEISFFDRVSMRDVVIVSRQISTLFEAQVSALRIFRLLAEEVESEMLKKAFVEIADDLQGGSSISRAMSKHPKIFSDFYVNMVRSGEETGKLDETFMYLADYLDRTYEVTSKVRSALMYPAFVVFTFIAVMWLMLALVIPKLGDIMSDSGIEPPIYTKVVLGLSDAVSTYGWVLLLVMAGAGFAFWRYYRTDSGRYMVDEMKLKLPGFGNLYSKLYLSRIADNVSTMMSSGISMVRTIEITASVVDNAVFKEILTQSIYEIKNGSTVSSAFGKHPEMPGILVQMIKVGEESGELGAILKTLATFYRREVDNAVDTMIGLIEPVMIVMLGLGVGVLLASVLIPVYNITLSIS